MEYSFHTLFVAASFVSSMESEQNAFVLSFHMLAKPI